MQLFERLTSTSPMRVKTGLKRFCIVVIFGIAFGYIEAAVVVYLRAIFHPDGFTFPLVIFGGGPLREKLMLIEVGREAATLILILTGTWLFGANRRQRFWPAPQKLYQLK